MNESHFSPRWAIAAPLLVLIAALSSRLAVLIWALRSRLFLEFDDVWFLELAKNLSEGRGYTDWWGVTNTHFPPLFPILIAGLHYAGIEIITAGRLVGVISGSLCAVAGWWFAKKLFDDLTGLVAGLMVALHPHLIAYSASVILPEATYTLFLTLGMAMWFASREGNWGTRNKYMSPNFRAVAYLSFMLSYLLRPEGILYFAALGVYDAIEWVSLITGGQTFLSVRKRTFLRVSIPVAVFMVVGLPYMVFIHQATGRWSLTGKTANVWANARSADPVRNDTWRDARYYRGSMAFRNSTETVDANGVVPGSKWDSFNEIFHRYFNNLRTLVLKTRKPILPIAALMLIAAGFIIDALRKTDLKRYLWVICPLLPTVLLFPVFYLMLRYFVPFLVFLCILEARGIANLLNLALSKGKTMPRVVIATCGSLAIYALIVMQSSPRIFMGGQQTETWKTTVNWLRGNAEKGSVLMSDRPAMAFETDLKWIVTPRGLDPLKLVEFAQNKGVRYCLIDTWRKESPPRASDGQLVEGVEEVFKAGTAGFDQLVILRLSPAEQVQ